jgi:hypothetical protein
MTADDEVTPETKAVRALTLACFDIAKQFNVCALCLLYAAADSAEEAEEKGFAFHVCTLEANVHPPHKTIV